LARADSGVSWAGAEAGPTSVHTTKHAVISRCRRAVCDGVDDGARAGL